MSLRVKIFVLIIIPVLGVIGLGAGTALYVTIAQHDQMAVENLSANLKQLRSELDQLAEVLGRTAWDYTQDHALITTGRSLASLREEEVSLRRDLVCQLLQNLQRNWSGAGCDQLAFYGPNGLYGQVGQNAFTITVPGSRVGQLVFLTPKADSSLLECPGKNWREIDPDPNLRDRLDLPAHPVTRFSLVRGRLILEGLAPIKLTVFSTQTFKAIETTVGAVLARREIGQEFILGVARKIGATLDLLGPDGRLVAGSHSTLPAEMAGLAVDAIAGGGHFTDLTLNGESYYLALDPYYHQGRPVLVLAAYAPREAVNREARRIIYLQLTGLVFGLAVALGLALVVGRFMARPITMIARQMDEIATTKDFSRRITVAGQDEIGSLASSFNGMTIQLQEHTDHLEDLVARRTTELSESLARLGEANQRILESIQYGRTIQRALLPRPEIMATHLGDYGLFWQPKDVIGGDFYWVHPTDRGFFLAVMDCTGHGVPGAIMTMIAATGLGRVVQDDSSRRPDRVLGQLHRLVRQTLGQENPGTRTANQSDDGLDIGLCFVDIKDGTLYFSGAHLNLFVDDGVRIVEIKGDKVSLGYRSAPAEPDFQTTAVSWNQGWRFFLATDGLIDQIGGDKQLPFGKGRLIRHFEKLRGWPLSSLEIVFREAFVGYQGGEIQRDDVTVLGFSPNCPPGLGLKR